MAYSSVVLLIGGDPSEIFCVLCLNSEDFKTACIKLHMESYSCRAVKCYGWSLEDFLAPKVEVSTLDSREKFWMEKQKREGRERKREQDTSEQETEDLKLEQEQDEMGA